MLGIPRVAQHLHVSRRGTHTSQAISIGADLQGFMSNNWLNFGHYGQLSEMRPKFEAQVVH
jgi:hypothetical protein